MPQLCLLAARKKISGTDDVSAAKLRINCLRISFKAENEQCEAHTVPLPAQVVALLRSIYLLTRHRLNMFSGELRHNIPAPDNCGA